MEALEQKLDLAFEKIDDIRDRANKAHTLAEYAARGHVELKAQIDSMKTIQETILQNQQNTSAEIAQLRSGVDELTKRIASNFKWTIATIIAMLFSFVGLLAALLKILQHLNG